MRTDQEPQSTFVRRSPAHEHGWCTESSHRTLEGMVRYVRCLGCGARRIDLSGPTEVVPGAVSRVLGGGALLERTVSVTEQRS